MNAPDLLEEYFVANPREAAGLEGRAGMQGEVDTILNELRIPATVDDDGDWELKTDVGLFLLVADKETSDLVAVQTMQPLEREAESSSDEMHVLLALNYQARGLARFGAIKDGDRDLLVLSARLGIAEVSRDALEAMLRDCFQLSRRLDELLGRAPAGAPEPEPPAEGEPRASAEPQAAEPELAPPADPAPLAQSLGAADVTRMASPIPTSPLAQPDEGSETSEGEDPAPTGPPLEPAPESSEPEPAADEPVVAADVTRMASPIPEPVKPEPEPAKSEPVPEPVSQQPDPVSREPDPAPAYQPPAAPTPEPAPAAPMPPPQPSLPPANWYPDPHHQARLRYWDGQRWTEHVAN